MTQTTINGVNFRNQFEDSSEKYFYQFAMSTLIEKSELNLEALDGDFLQYIYAINLQQIFADFCNCKYNGGYDFEFEDMEYPFADDAIFVLHKYYFCDIIDDKQTYSEYDEMDYFDYDPAEKMTDKERSYYEKIEGIERQDLLDGMLDDLIAYFRPIVAKILLDNYSTSMLYSAMTCALEKKTVLLEEECDGEKEYYEEEVNYESFDEYLAVVNSCGVCNDLSGIEAFEWINEGMYDRN